MEVTRFCIVLLGAVSSDPRECLAESSNLVIERIDYSLSNSFAGLKGAKFICFQDRQWHSECFNCGKCSISLVGEGFLTQNMEIFCRKCGSGMDSDI